MNVTFNEPTVENNKKVIEDGVIFENAFYGIYNATSPYSFYTYPIHDFMVSEY